MQSIYVIFSESGKCEIDRRWKRANWKHDERCIVYVHWIETALHFPEDNSPGGSVRRHESVRSERISCSKKLGKYARGR